MRKLKASSWLVLALLIICCKSKLLYCERLIILLGQYYIRDVWGQPPSSTAGWSNACTSYCFGQTLIGGYGCFGEGASTTKTYNIDLVHTAVSIEWDAYFVDSWDGESYILKVDGVTQFSQSYSTGSLSSVDSCGGDWADYRVTKSIGPITHTASTLQLYFTSTLNQESNDETFGFKNIKITVWPVCATGCATCYGNSISQCNSCSDGWYLSGSTCVTDCGPGYWNDPTGNVCTGKFSLILPPLNTLIFRSLSCILL